MIKFIIGMHEKMDSLCWGKDNKVRKYLIKIQQKRGFGLVASALLAIIFFAFGPWAFAFGAILVICLPSVGEKK